MKTLISRNPLAPFPPPLRTPFLSFPFTKRTRIPSPPSDPVTAQTLPAVATPTFQRRRGAAVPAPPAILAALLLLVLFLAVLSFLAPTPSHHSPLLVAGGVEQRRDVIAVESFVVPSGGGSLGQDLWRSRRAKEFYGCSNATEKFPKVEAVTRPNRYLMIATSGGLNQQRTGITDAVVAARILNATLVVPKLDQKSFWKDTSTFTEIFNVDWFISSLAKDVKIVKQLPKKGGKSFASPYHMRVPRKCTPRCYQNRVLPVLMKKHVVQLSKFDYRLSNKLETDLQKLRCRVNFHALKFTYPILKMGNTVIQRMRKRSKHFIALHLRFEPDMLAFSGCYYGGGEKERKDLAAIRRRWKTLHTKNPEKERRHGKCPLTPEEVGLMLRALGFGSDVHIYVASGEIYGGEETLAPLRTLFPNFHSKDTLTTKEELEPFSAFSSRMAALDYMVCDESDVFVTNNNGNMAKMLAGRRRYFGHKRTIRPNAKKLYSLFLNRTSMSWEAFASKVRTNQRGFMGEPNEVRPGRGEFHENPSACICETPEAAAGPKPGSRLRYENEIPGRNSSNLTFDRFRDEEEESEWPDVEDAGYEMGSDLNTTRTDTDYDLFIRSEEPELEEIFSD